MSIKSLFTVIYFIILLLIPLVLIILPADFFNNGQSICLSIFLFDRECYGCGMTRAIQHIMHLDFYQAYIQNKLSFLVFPILALAWFSQVSAAYKKTEIILLN